MPAVFGTFTEGHDVVEVDEDDRDGCAEVSGTFDLRACGDGTLQLGSVEGFNSIRERVESSPSASANSP